MKKTSITLIGMPSAGKTYLGKRLAEKYNKKWVNLDTTSYSKVLGSGGTEADYILLEEKVLLSAKGKDKIFSPGGSSVYSGKGMRHLKDISEIIYLKIPLAVAEERLGDFSNRGVVKAEKMSLKNLYSERCPLYERYADHIIDCETNSTEQQFSNLCRLIENL